MVLRVLAQDRFIEPLGARFVDVAIVVARHNEQVSSTEPQVGLEPAPSASEFLGKGQVGEIPGHDGQVRVEAAQVGRQQREVVTVSSRTSIEQEIGGTEQSFGAQHLVQVEVATKVWIRDVRDEQP
jgi:hypothetical protein